MGEELKTLHWTERDLAQRQKGDSAQVRMAERLRRETTRSLAWMAQRLLMGSQVVKRNREVTLKARQCDEIPDLNRDDRRDIEVSMA